MSGARPDTWMPWYIGDYLRDTMHLDAEQDGAYRRLIDACWLRGGILPDEDTQFATITKLGLKRWKAVRPVIEPFFTVTAKGWSHGRVTRELEKASRISAARAANGKMGGRPKSSKNQPEDQTESKPITGGKANANLNETQPRPQPPSQEENEKDRADLSPRRSAAKAYAFEGKIIKLNEKDLNAWRAAYHAIPDIRAELQAIDDKFAAEPPGRAWFGTASAWLRTKHERLLRERQETSPTTLFSSEDREKNQREARIKGYRVNGFWLPEWGEKPPPDDAPRSAS